MELRLTCLLASSMALSNCLASVPHSRVFSSSRSWDWWIASSLLAITCRNSIFWALVASSFLGENTWSDAAHTPSSRSTPPGGCQPPLDQGSHHAKNLQGATGINQRNLRISQEARNCIWSSCMRSRKSKHRLSMACAKCTLSHVVRQLAAWKGGFHYYPFTDEETQPQRRKVIGPSAQLAGLAEKPMPSTFSVHCCLPQQRDFCWTTQYPM